MHEQTTQDGPFISWKLAGMLSAADTRGKGAMWLTADRQSAQSTESE